ncbi:General secretion pathway protein I [Cellvibrio sp. BR]|jgi:general secretion pathway protein I|uniref:type II secretion system minor pseudopilin GspI n=1 Tax=unclassified Cellvibrio TaxID=2624793 RepID=UPI0002601630|nr:MULTISPECIES: type II secretion system minor pseudopilin GspI [unclassified Cellvibrio]EIK46807.1 General secretion pathway protein I [Cellvibrio sp. BR]UUA71304.1 type II secretion system minor pseudopilin GspI [Cellvibrio sp. QJXJ]
MKSSVARIFRTRQERGFTLLEAMIALMIVAMALPALITLVMTQLDGSAAIRDKTYAYWVAENELARVRLLQQQKAKKALASYQLPEKDSGVVDLAGLRWQWQLTTLALDTLPVQGFKRVEIAVRLMGPADGVSLGSAMVDQDQPALARLTGYISDPEIVQ